MKSRIFIRGCWRTYSRRSLGHEAGKETQQDTERVGDLHATSISAAQKRHLIEGARKEIRGVGKKEQWSSELMVRRTL